MSGRRFIIIMWAALAAACGGPDGGAGDACGPYQGCRPEFFCEAATQRCVGRAVVERSDAAPPVREPDAHAGGEPDAHAGGEPDAHAGGEPDARAGVDADVAAPAVTITAPGEGETIAAGATLEVSVSEPAAAILCAIDGAEAVVCGSGRAASLAIPSTLEDGRHTAAVLAIDLAGNHGEPATRAFVVARPKALVVTTGARATPCLGEAITFSASDASATFRCALDGAAGAPCASPFALPASLPGGAHSLTVTASVGATSAATTLAFLIDATPAAVTITGSVPAPDAAMKVDPEGIIFFASTKPVTARCALDGAAAVDCTSPLLEGSFRYAGLDDRDNPHRATVTVTDACGATASASIDLAVDSTGPAPCLVDARTTGGRAFNAGGACLAAPPTTGGAGSLTFDAEPGVYQCTVTTAGGAAAAASPAPGVRFDCSPGKPIVFSGQRDFGDEPHPYTLVVDGLDAHGNASKTLVPWLVDTTGPAIQLQTLFADQTRGEVVASYADLGDVTFPTCSMEGSPCSCGSAQARCGKASAGANRPRLAARDAFGNDGPQVAPSVDMTYGPHGGRAVLLGFDLDSDDPDATALVRAAVRDVPWKQSGIFDRPLRVLIFQAGRPRARERTNLDAALAPLIDSDGSATLDDRDVFALQTALAGKDVLIVEDQNDPQSAQQTGDLWNDTGPFRRFLDQGGVVVVLDGLSPGGAPSETWRVLAGGQDPILAVRSSAPASQFVLWSYAPTLTELVFGTPSELRTESFFVAPAGAVTFDVIDQEAPRDTFVAGESGSAVVEKIFPVYAPTIDLSGIIAPGARLTIGSNAAREDVAAIECAVEVLTCRNPAGCCPTGDPHAERCACPAVDPALGQFTTPSRSGSYQIEGRILSPHTPGADPYPRPGRTVFTVVVVPEPQISLHQVVDGAAPTGHFCYHGVDIHGAPLAADVFRPQHFADDLLVDDVAVSPAGCPDPDDVGSFFVCQGQGGGVTDVRLDAVDPEGNLGQAFLFERLVPGCD